MHFLTAIEAQRALTLAGLLCKQGDLGKDAVIQSHDIEIVALGLHTIVILAGYALPEVPAEPAPE